MTDREIREALAADPSPEFVARVRMRIANEPAAADHRIVWWFAASLAAAVIAFAVVSKPARPTALPSTLTAHGPVGVALPVPSRAPILRPFVASDASRTAPAPVVSGSPAPEAQNARRGSRTSSVVSRTSEPEILLAPDETRALRALIAGVREGRIDLTPVIDASTPSVMELEPIRDIVIPPIVIAPVEGVRQ